MGLFRFCTLVLILSSPNLVKSNDIILEGIYQGKNIFIRNPFSKAEGKFCITDIYVNGNRLNNIPRTSAIQIDLSQLSLKESITIRISHLDTCMPVIVNPEVIKMGRGFEFLFTQIDDNSINWITTGESQGGKFEIEKLKWKGWEKIMEVDGKGQLDNNQYSIEANHYTGNNNYRVIYKKTNDESFNSEEINFYSLRNPVKIFPGEKVFDWISLSRETDYEIYDEYDSLLMKGVGSEINVIALGYGEYSIVVENEPMRFYIPEPEIIPRRKRRKNNKQN